MKLELGSICNRSGTANSHFQTLHHKQQRPLLWWVGGFRVKAYPFRYEFRSICTVNITWVVYVIFTSFYIK
jgi:hypothetical protein